MKRREREYTATLHSHFLPAALINHKPKLTWMFPSDTNIESLLGIKLRPKLSQEMAERANYLTGNIFHFKTRLWGTLQSAECLKKGRERDTKTGVSRTDPPKLRLPCFVTWNRLTFISWGVII